MRHARKREMPSFGIYLFLLGLIIILVGSHFSYQYMVNSVTKQKESYALHKEITHSLKPKAMKPTQELSKGKTKGSTLGAPLNSSSQYHVEPHSFNDFIHMNMTVQVVAPMGKVRNGPDLDQDVIATFKKDSILFSNMMIKKGATIWYHITGAKSSGWISDKLVRLFELPKDGVLINAPLISQLPELQRGCEVTSLAMLINNTGQNVTKMQLAKEIKKNPTKFQLKNGHVYFGNPNTGFVGNIYNIKKPGLGVYHEPVFKLAQKYLGKHAIDLTGKSFDAVLHQINDHHPVWVILSSTFRPLPDEAWETWYTPTGKVKITYKEHSVLVTGYDSKYIYFNDPLADKKDRRVKRSDFIASWKQFGKQAISYH